MTTEAGPGVIWSAMPVELVVEGLLPAYTATADLELQGRMVQVRPEGDGTGTVVRLLSGDSQDYLDPRFQPGRRIRLHGAS